MFSGICCSNKSESFVWAVQKEPVFLKQARLSQYLIRWVHAAFERNKGFVSRLKVDLIKRQPWLISSLSNRIVSSYLLRAHQFPLAVQHDSSTAIISSARHLPALHLPLNHPRLPPCFYWQPPLLWHFRVPDRHWGWHGARLPCLWVEVPQLNWDLEGRPGIWDMGQEEERNFKWKRSGYCVVKYIVLFWTSELNKGLFLLEYVMTTSCYIFSANIKNCDFISMELYNASPNVLSETRM